MAKRNAWFFAGEFFQRALAYGRGYSLLLQETEVSENSLLAGISWAIDALPGVVPPEVILREKKFRNSRDRLRAILNTDPSPIFSKLPKLARNLQHRLSRTQISCEDFIGLLFTREEDFATNNIHRKILGVASGYARHYGHTEISREIYSVAAYRVYLNGGMTNKRSLSNYMALARDCFRYNETQIQPWPKEVDETAKGLLELEPEMVLSIDSEDDKKNLIISALNFANRRAAAQLQRRPTAIHEAGHAVASFALLPHVPIVRASIEDPFSTSGFVEYSGTDPTSVLDNSKSWYSRRIAVALAGRAAEISAYGPMRASSGASSDIDTATSLVWSMVAEWGLDPEFAPVRLETIKNSLGTATGWLFDQAQKRVFELLREAHELALQVLKENWTLVTRLADALERREVLEADEILGVLVETGLKELPESILATKKTETRRATFATQPGDCQTREGPVRYVSGDALVEGSDGEIWPVHREQFHRTYEAVDGKVFGTDGLYRTLPEQRYVLQVGFDRQVQLTGTRGTLFAKAGDWLVDYGQGDIAVVSGDLFDRYYEIGK